MAVVDMTTEREVAAHRRSFVGFERLVMFAAMHIALVLASLALAFLGHAPVIGFLMGVGGTIALITAFAVTRS